MHLRPIAICLLAAAALHALCASSECLGQAQPAPLPPPDGRRYGQQMVCRDLEEIQRQLKPVTAISLSDYYTSRETPPTCSENLFGAPQPPHRVRAELIDFNWRPTEFFHQPLYFDDTPLERYGQSICPKLQPVISGVRFFATVPIVPYKIGVDRTHDCVSVLGHYRPGTCAPCVKETLPWEWDAALFQTGTVLGMVFLLP